MASFTDNKERVWDLPQLDALVVKRIRDECDPDFLVGDAKTGYDSTFDRMLNDPVLLCGVIYLLCDKQRKQRDITQEEFYIGVIGDAIDAATTALLETVRSFSPRRTREMLDALAKQQDLHAEAIRRLNAKLSAPGAIDQALERLERKAATLSSSA